RRRHRAVRQRHRRFPAGPVHRLRLLHHRLPVQHPEVQPGNAQGVQVHALLRTRRRGAGARLHQGVPHRLPALRHQGGDARAGRGPGGAAPQGVGLRPRRGLRPSGGPWHPRPLRPARRHQPGSLRRPAVESARSLDRLALEAATQVARQPGHGRWPDRPVRALPALRTQDRRGGPGRASGGETAMSDSLLLPHDRVVRYNFRERLMHWLSGFSSLYLLLSGLAFWSPWLFWLTAILGGPTIARELHPWFGVIFTIAVLWMWAIWGSQMHFTARDREWLRSLKHYIRNEDGQVPDEDRFHAGQTRLFWGFLVCGLLLFLSGLVLWEPHWIPWSLRILRL